MLEKPKLPEAVIGAALQTHYGLVAKSLIFLPIGNDPGAWVYRVETEQGPRFLKLRQGQPKLSALHAPHYLRRQGIIGIAAPLAARSKRLYAALDDFSLVLYPWIEGTSAWNMPLSAEQWRAWGAVMRLIHDSPITAALADMMPREDFKGRYARDLDRLQQRINAEDHSDKTARAMARAWREKQPQIEQARARYLDLGQQFGAAASDWVLCHADIHRANIIIDKTAAIHIVDWDEAIIAPKERDLMFFAADGHSPAAVAAFQRGYGQTSIDPVGLAYYRYDWLLQEFCDNGGRVFLSETLGKRERQQAFDEFKRLFAPGDVFDRARQAYRQIP